MSVLPLASLTPKGPDRPNKSGERPAIRRRYLAIRAARLAAEIARRPGRANVPRRSELCELRLLRHRLLHPPSQQVRRGKGANSWEDPGYFLEIVGLRRSRTQYDPDGPRPGKEPDDEPGPSWDDHVRLLEDDEWQLAYQDYGPDTTWAFPED